MGLDMYGKALKAAPLYQTDFEYDQEAAEEIHYWRKHPNLHGWMERLYRLKGGSATDFNCVPVVLTSEDLDRLETDIVMRRLPGTTGFFFGSSAGDEKEIQDDIDFVVKARAAIARGETVFYSAWW